jgi:hypothetical protein
MTDINFQINHMKHFRRVSSKFLFHNIVAQGINIEVLDYTIKQRELSCILSANGKVNMDRDRFRVNPGLNRKKINKIVRSNKISIKG